LPEGSEVRIITDRVSKLILDRTITQLKIMGGRFVKKPPAGFDDFQKAISSRALRVTDVNCHGKFMYWTLERDWSVWISLGMTGNFSRSIKTPHAALRWSHALSFMDRTTTRNLFFVDQRRFGTVKFVQDPAALDDKLNSLGNDLLATDPGWEQLHEALLRRPKQEITQALMDQGRFAGVGNYVKADALYRAKISPKRNAGSITAEESQALYSAIRLIFQDSYEIGCNGARYQKICYRQKTDLNGNPIIKEQTADRRTTWWCPAIQV